MVIFSICLIAGVAFAATPNEYTGLPEDYTPAHNAPGNDDFNVQGRDLTVYFDADEFIATFPEIAANPECFDATNVPPFGITACEGPFNSATNNDCFSAGALMDGFSLYNDGAPGDDLNVVIGDGALGNVGIWAGPNTFASNIIVEYMPPVDTIAFLWQFPMGAIDITLEVYGPEGNYIGAVDWVGALDQFLGIASTDPIGMVVGYSDGGAELADCIWFGNGAVANENSSWTTVKGLYR